MSIGLYVVLAFLSYFKGFSIDAGRGEFVFLQVDPFQVGNAIKGFSWDAADAVSCRLEEN